MPLYESVFIARQDVTSQQVDGLTDTLKSIISEQGGDVAKTEYWGLRTLAYRIKKNRKGHYVLMNINAPADAVKEMERNLRLNEDIIRFMTVKVDAHEEGPSAVLQSRQSRDGRGGRGGRPPRDGGRGGPRDRDRDRDRGAPRERSGGDAGE